VSERVVVSSIDGLCLEGELETPDDARAAVAVCHAHPQMQGTMRSPLLLALRDEMTSRGFAILRFNFRGVGDSEGESSDGTAEVSDALGALRFLRERFHGLPVALAGWSFGGVVALRATAADGALAGCATIAPAVAGRPGVTAGLGDDVQIDVPVLVVCGSNDKVVRPEECRAWAEAAGARYLEIPAANHFFWAKYEPVSAAVAGFFEDCLS
jgi:alpha/beta superfamily hydrolase